MAQLRRNQADLLVRDFPRECVFDWFEPLHSAALARNGNLIEYLLPTPLWLELDFASFDELHNKRDDGAQSAITNPPNFFERVSFVKKPKRFLSGMGISGRVNLGARRCETALAPKGFRLRTFLSFSRRSRGHDAARRG